MTLIRPTIEHGIQGQTSVVHVPTQHAPPYWSPSSVSCQHKEAISRYSSLSKYLSANSWDVERRVLRARYPVIFCQLSLEHICCFNSFNYFWEVLFLKPHYLLVARCTFCRGDRSRWDTSVQWVYKILFCRLITNFLKNDKLSLTFIDSGNILSLYTLYLKVTCIKSCLI